MITEDLIIYIQNQLKKNVSKDLIISRLIQVGWHEKDIEEGFENVALANNPQPNLISLDTPFIDQIKKDGPATYTSIFSHTPIVTPTSTPIVTPTSTPIVTPTSTPIVTPTSTPIVSHSIFEKKEEEFIPVKEIEIKKEEEKIIEIIKLDANEIEAPNELVEINQPAPEEIPQVIQKVWTPMRVNPISPENEVPAQIILDKNKVSFMEPVKTEIKTQPLKIEPQLSAFDELIPKLIEKNNRAQTPFVPIKIIDPDILNNPAVPIDPIFVDQVLSNPIPVNQVPPIIPIIPENPIPVKEPVVFPIITEVSSLPPIEKNENPIVPPVILKTPVIPLSPSVLETIKKNERPGGFLDLSNGFKKQDDSQKDFPGVTIKEELDPLEISKKAMIASYSQALSSADVFKQKSSSFAFNKKIFVKIIIAIFILGFIGGLSYAYIGGYLKIPNFTMPFVRQDPKATFLKNGEMFSNVKSYKVATEINISLPSLSNITNSLVNGQNINSSDRDNLSLSLKGSVNQEGEYKSDFTSTIKSSILKNDIVINFKKENNTSYATISDFSQIFGQNFPQLGMIKIDKDKIKLISPELSLGLNDKTKELAVYNAILNGIFDDNKIVISSALNDLVKDLKISKDGEEAISGVDTYKYAVAVDRPVSKKFLGQLVNILTKDNTIAKTPAMDELLGSVTIDTFEVWIGKTDNNIHQYKISLKTPLSKVIEYEDKGIADSEISFDIQSTYSDFDVANNISMPTSSIGTDEFLNVIKDNKIKQAVSAFKVSARSLFNIQGNYSKIANNTGVCDASVSGSLFSPLGHPTVVNNVIGDIASSINNILALTNKTGICYSNAQSWAMSVPLNQNTGDYYCIDSTNESPKISTTLLSDTICK